MKKCCMCKKDLPLDSFNNNKRTKDGKQTACRKCQKEKYDIYRRAHPEIAYSRNRKFYKNHQLEMLKRKSDYIKRIGKDEYRKQYQKHSMTAKFKRYGLSEERYHEMREEQGQKCAMCSKSFTDNPKSIHIDHCHETGKVRGILCDGCNLFLGRLESPDYKKRVEMAEAYLRKTEK
jgi:hypothetical protein